MNQFMKTTPIIAGITLCAVLLAQTPPLPSPAPSVRRVALAAAAAPSPVQLRISWSYPTNEMSSDLTFRVYHATNLPPAWELQTSVVGTNAATVVAIPGVHFYAVKTYSQFWDVESDFSDAVATPAAPKQGSNLSISR